MSDDDTGGAATSPARPSEPVDLAPTETAGTGSARAGFSPAVRAVLEQLKAAGDVSADDLAVDLAITVSAVRQHLRPLEEQGLVAHRDERTGPGRPRRHYCLAPAAESLWPKRYGQLTNQLLGFVEATDPDLVARVFDQRGAERTRRAEMRLVGKPFDERVRELAMILDEDGYLADATHVAPGFWTVNEHNCAVLDVARRYDHACTSELAFLRAAVPDADIERVAHIVSGAHSCVYEIRQRSAA
ncbi:MAG: helix-turn-helix domain-containing protein [Actinomycetota bacterium]|nr:helix-turn-helix domain-containing protein [Actinomycetota bacterium]